MADYDFRSLSGYDFALLARDLLQVPLRVQLESFSAGPDSGIDFRYRSEHTNLIVQCKHYVESGYSALTSILRRKERQKIDELAPTRYILATSVPLTPNRKDEIKSILGPHCLRPADIVGREDLNNLLSQNPEIERRHFKLWLTSEVVLRRVLDAGIIADSEAHLERVRLRLCRYVQNPSFGRARALLDKYHYCIIAGIPGIGKTTLAEVLLADLVDRQKFEPFRIAHDLDEIRPVKNSKRKQVFYFDDFLGRTALEKLQKNEDRRLIELMEEVAANPNWRFILTTREYILNSARLGYEAFAHPLIDFMLCVINLDDYTRTIRGRILYNHLYFSDLPKSHKLALLQNRGYENILRHRNYNPRVIEYMTQSRHASTVAPSLYLAQFINSLDNPARIWDHAFRHQISEASRHLLLVLSTLPDTVMLPDCEAAFWTFYRFRQGRFGFPTSSGDWEDALKQLDGSFITTKRVGRDIVIGFHSPSVCDFVEGFLDNSEGDVADLINGAHFYDQFRSLWTGHGYRHRRFRGVALNRKEFLDMLRKNLFGPSADALRCVDSNGTEIGMSHWSPSNESRAEFVATVANDLKNEDGDRFLEALVKSLLELWDQGYADKADLVLLLSALTERGLKEEDNVFITAYKCLLSKLEEVDDFRALARFVEKYPNGLPSTELENVKREFLDFASDYSVGWDAPDRMREAAADLEFIGERLAIDVKEYTGPLLQEAEQIEIEGGEGEPVYDRDDSEPGSYGDDVDQMFGSLLEDIEG